MQSILVYTPDQHNDFLDEWLPHRNSNEFWSICGILTNATLGAGTWAFQVGVHHGAATFSSFGEMYADIANLTLGALREKRAFLPHSYYGRDSVFQVDQNSLFFGEELQLLVDESAMALRLIIERASLEMRLEQETPVQWAGRGGGVRICPGAKTRSAMFAAWLPGMECVAKRALASYEPQRLEGKGAFERMWGVFPAQNAKVHWEKFHLFLNDGGESVIFNFPYGKHARCFGYSLSSRQGILPLESPELTAIDYLEIDDWRFATSWRLEVPGEETMFMVPLLKQQYVLPTPRPILGIYDRNGEHLGYGFGELMAGARNELRVITKGVYSKYLKDV